MPTDITKIIGGPALVMFGGASFYSKGNIVLESAIDTFDINVDRYRKVDERAQEMPLRVRFTPAGEWEALSVLYPYPNAVLGELITPTRKLSALETVQSTFVAAAGVANGSRVFVSTTGVLPAGWSASIGYFLGKQASPANTYSLYDTRANALVGAGTGKATITDVGTGTVSLIVQEQLVIHSFAGERYTFHNAAVTQMPNINASTIATLFDEVIFECFLKNNTAWSAVDARFTLDTSPLSDTSFDPAAIITQAYLLDWGAAPWAALSTKTGVQINFGLQLEAVMTDADGIVTRRLAGVEASAQATPMGISEADLMAALQMQGASAGRGKTLVKNDLTLTGTGVYIKLSGAALKGGPQNFSSAEDRIGQLNWVATRTFSGGVPNPLFFVGIAAP
jgi:hypothetical protein